MPASAVVTRPADGDADDRDLVAGVRAGDDRAFEVLYERYQPRIAAYVRGMVRDHGRAEDITQEVFISALRRMREDTEREILFKPWIYEIAKNRCIDVFRRSRTMREVSFDACDAIGAAEQGRLAQPGATPDSAVEGKAAIDNLCGAFGGLSATHHDVLVLRELEGLSYREIGERLGMSRPAVESTLFRARKRLTEEYEEIVSGARCRRVQRIVDASGGAATGLRDQRRLARHLAHCQPCRRHAGRAAAELGTVSPPVAAAARIAAWLPLPACLRRRGGGDDAAGPLLGHGGGSVGQWTANVTAVVDPGLVASWVKAAATAATVAVAGVGAGAAFTDRTPLGRAGAPVTPLSQGPDPAIFAAGHEAAAAGRVRAVKRDALRAWPAAVMPRDGTARPAAAATEPVRAPAATPAETPANAGSAPGRPLVAAPSRPAADRGVTGPIGRTPNRDVGRVLGSIGASASGASPAGGGGADVSGLLNGVTAPVAGIGSGLDAAAHVPGATITGTTSTATAVAGSVPSTVTVMSAPTTTALDDLGR